MFMNLTETTFFFFIYICEYKINDPKKKYFYIKIILKSYKLNILFLELNLGIIYSFIYIL